MIGQEGKTAIEEKIRLKQYGRETIRVAILGITPQLLIESLGLGKFNIKRTQYNFEKDCIEFVLEHDAFPETPVGECLPILAPWYRRVNGYQVELAEITILQNGQAIKIEDLEPFKSETKMED